MHFFVLFAFLGFDFFAVVAPPSSLESPADAGEADAEADVLEGDPASVVPPTSSIASLGLPGAVEA